MNQADSWNKVKKNLQNTQPQHAYATWFEPLVCIGLNDKSLVVEVPNQFFFEWIQSHYKEIIRNEVVKVYGDSVVVKYTVSPEGSERAEAPKINKNVEKLSLIHI